VCFHRTFDRFHHHRDGISARHTFSATAQTVVTNLYVDPGINTVHSSRSQRWRGDPLATGLIHVAAVPRPGVRGPNGFERDAGGVVSLNLHSPCRTSATGCCSRTTCIPPTRGRPSHRRCRTADQRSQRAHHIAGHDRHRRRATLLPDRNQIPIRTVNFAPAVELPQEGASGANPNSPRSASKGAFGISSARGEPLHRT